MRKSKAVKVLSEMLADLSELVHDGQLPGDYEMEALNAAEALATAIQFLEKEMEISREYSRKYRERYPEKRREIDARYREKHREELRERNRARYNKEQAAEFRLISGGKEDEKGEVGKRVRGGTARRGKGRTKGDDDPILPEDL